MKLSKLRQIYQSLPESSKNIKWRRLSEKELDIAMCEPQVISNCYDESTRYSLLASEKGRDLIKKRLWCSESSSSDIPAYKVVLNLDGQNTAFVSRPDDYYSDFLDLTQEYNNLTKEDTPRLSNLSLGINIAIDKMIEKYPKMKPLLSRVFCFARRCEYNRPSNAFKWFTGREPVSIGESDMTLSLKSHKKEVDKVIESLAKKDSKDYSFIAMTGPFPLIKKRSEAPHELVSWHCYSIVGVNDAKEVSLRNPRTRNITTLSYDDFLKKFKGLVGIEY